MKERILLFIIVAGLGIFIYIFQSYFNTFKEISSLQRETYELMFKNGWYSLEKENNNKISEKIQILSQEYQDLNLE